MVITFAGALRQALDYCIHLSAKVFSCADGTLLLLAVTLNTVEPILTVMVTWSHVVSTSMAVFLTLIGEGEA